MYFLPPERTRRICFSGEVKVLVLDSKKSLRHQIPEVSRPAQVDGHSLEHSLEASGWWRQDQPSGGLASFKDVRSSEEILARLHKCLLF